MRTSEPNNVDPSGELSTVQPQKDPPGPSTSRAVEGITSIFVSHSQFDGSTLSISTDPASHALILLATVKPDSLDSGSAILPDDPAHLPTKNIGAGSSQNEANLPEGSSDHHSSNVGEAVASVMVGHGRPDRTGGGSSSAGPDDPSDPPSLEYGSLGAGNPGGLEDPKNGNGEVARVAGQSVYSDPNDPGGIVFGDVSIPLGQVATVAGVKVYNGPKGVAVGTSSAVPLPPLGSVEAAAMFTVGGEILTASLGKALLVDGTTISANGPAATFDGKTISIDTSGVVVDGSLITASPMLTYLSDSVSDTGLNSAGSSQVQVAYTDASGILHTAVEDLKFGKAARIDGSVTLNFNGPDMVVDGKTFNLASNKIFIDGSAESFDMTKDPSGYVEAEAVYMDAARSQHTLVGSMAGQSTAVIDGSITLTIGNSATVADGKTLSLVPGGLVIDGSTIPFSLPPDLSTSTKWDAVFTDAKGHMHTAVELDGQSNTAIIDGSIIITIGEKSTVIYGETLSLAPGGMVVDGTTHTFSILTSTSITGSSSPGSDAFATPTSGAGSSADGTSKATPSLGFSMRYFALTVITMVMNLGLAWFQKI